MATEKGSTCSTRLLLSFNLAIDCLPLCLPIHLLQRRVDRLVNMMAVMILGPTPIFPPFILHSRSLVPHLFPHVPLGPPPNHLTSHLMDHLTIPQSTITCHHSAVCSIPQHHHLTHYGLLAHDALSIDHQLMMELYLDCQLIASS